MFRYAWSARNKGFKKMFAVSPTSIRKDKNLIIDTKTINIQPNFSLLKSAKSLTDIQVVFQQSKGKTGDDSTKENWNSLYTKASKHELINVQTKFYGINWDDPEITAKEKIRYDACIS